MTKNGSYSEYYCTGPYCTIDYTSNKIKSHDKVNCTGNFCSIKDTKSRENNYQCSGKNCSITVVDSVKSNYFVAKGIEGAMVTITKGEDLNVETVGENNHTTIVITDSSYSDGLCRGGHCNVTVVGSNNSRPSCEGYNCTAHGIHVSAGDLTLKVRCTGEACLARCSNSANCTAICKGVKCKAVCYNNTICQATCEGPGCETSCAPGAGGTCKTLNLPKKSICRNCLHAPQIWDWETCTANVTDCMNCYTAHWDLLGLNLYRLGCLDNQTEADVCGLNEYIKACYVYTCKDDLCTNTLMYNLVNPAPEHDTKAAAYCRDGTYRVCCVAVLYHFLSILVYQFQ